MPEISFCELKEGDLFKYSGQIFRVIPMEKVGHCGCVPGYNAVDVTDPNIKTMLSCHFQVEKVEDEI
jgi:hypothetical protein